MLRRPPLPRVGERVRWDDDDGEGEVVHVVAPRVVVARRCVGRPLLVVISYCNGWKPRGQLGPGLLLSAIALAIELGGAS